MLPSLPDDSPVPKCSIQLPLFPLLLNYSSFSRMPEISASCLDIGLDTRFSSVSRFSWGTFEWIADTWIFVGDVISSLESNIELGS